MCCCLTFCWFAFLVCFLCCWILSAVDRKAWVFDFTKFWRLIFFPRFQRFQRILDILIIFSWYKRRCVCLSWDFLFFLSLMILSSMVEYMHAHEKATAKSHRAMKTKDPSLYFLFLFDLWWTSARDEHRRNLEIPKLRQGQKCLCWNISLQVKMNEKVIAHRQRRTPPYTFRVCWCCPRHLQTVRTIRCSESEYGIASRLKEKDFRFVLEILNFSVFNIILSWGSTDTDTHGATWKTQTSSYTSLVSFVFSFHDGRQPETNIANIKKFEGFGKARNAFVEICA